MEPVEHIEADVPAGCTHRYEAAIDVVSAKSSAQRCPFHIGSINLAIMDLFNDH
jgi:hypothetical protein